MNTSVAFIQNRVANALAAATFSAAGIDATYDCGAGVAVGEAVYLSAANTVAEANASDPSTATFVGIVVSKPSSLRATVRSYGPVTLTGLTAGATYYLDTSAGLVTFAPPAGVSDVIVPVGFATSATTLFVQATQATSRLTDGSSLAPTYGFRSASGLGMYVADVDEIGFAAGGDLVMKVAQTVVTIAQNIELSGTAPRFTAIATNQGIDLRPNGTGALRLRNAANSATILGVETVASGNAGVVVRRTDSSGTPGNATQNTPAGKAAFAIGTNVVTITNDLIVAGSIVIPSLQSADATLTSIAATPGLGSCVFTGNGNAAATCVFSYVVLNPPA